MIKFYFSKYEYKENNWLSNFYFSPMIIDGIEYKTNEHYYQSQKFSDEKLKEWIRLCPKPNYLISTKILRIYLVPNWEKIKFEVMLKGLREKFSQNSILKHKLLDTGDEEIHEDSSDKVWGIEGDDMMGKLLMKVRNELRNQ